ncbi:MAG: hypothetical protein NTX75_13260 [Proteobacteria bacterium]|nr:hypothetical protein [Pseudomonadota bacterium]
METGIKMTASSINKMLDSNVDRHRHIGKGAKGLPIFTASWKPQRWAIWTKKI